MAVGYHDYYETLGVPRDASNEDIRRAYRALARKYHPDVNKEAGSEDRFKEIAEAYEVLRDTEKRKRYDQLGRDWRAGQDVSSTAGFGSGFGSGSGSGSGAGFGSGGQGVQFDFGGGEDFSDFFESLFGSGGRAQARGAGGSPFGGGPARGADHEASLDLTLEEAAAGGHRRLRLADGRDYDVNIPPGVRDGQRIRLAGEGAAGRAGGPSGDLFLRVRIKPHRRFRLDGNDLHVDLPVTPSEAALGAEVSLQGLSGPVRVRVPAGSSSGRVLRLRHEGMPAPRGEAGSLLAHIQIVVPTHLTARERDLYEQLAKASHENPRTKEST